MNNNKPLLSICIPTYNRSKYLKRSLDSVVIQGEFLNGMVEVVISDNASTDDTETVVKPYLEKYDNIYYYRNDENVRDKNFPIVLSKAHGQLRKLCNDTLVFKPDALRKICSIIKEYDNSRPFVFFANGSAKSNNAMYTMNFEDYVKDVSYWMTSIACFSIWDDECETIGTDFSGSDLLLWQVKKGLEIACKKNNILIVNMPMAKSQTVDKKSISYGLYHIFYENYFALFNPYFSSGILSNEVKEYLEKDLLFGFFAEWVTKWEIQPANLEYSKTENLKKDVWDAYSDKPYWRAFLCKYYVKLYFIKFKHHAKKLLGRE